MGMTDDNTMADDNDNFVIPTKKYDENQEMEDIETNINPTKGESVEKETDCTPEKQKVDVSDDEKPKRRGRPPKNKEENNEEGKNYDKEEKKHQKKDSSHSEEMEDDI